MGNGKSQPNIANSSTVSQEIQLNDVPKRERSQNDRNEEDITLIWFDDQKNTTDEEANKTKEILRLVNDYFLFYQDEQVCLNYIEKVIKEKVLLIVSGSSITQFITKTHNLKQVDSIFIFCCSDQDNLMETLMSDYPKIIGIYTDIQILKQAIQKTLDLIEKQSAAFSLYDENEKDTRDLTKESGSFLFFQLYKEVLLNMEQTTESKEEMIVKCNDYYKGNKKELENIKLFQTTYNALEAIKWYTKDSFVYRIINKALRTEDIHNLHTFRFYIIDLCKSLEQKYKDLKRRQKQSSTSVLKLYRGLKQTKEEVLTLQKNVGSLMSTNGYFSTSRQRGVAVNFAKKPSNRLDIEAVLFEIIVDTQMVKKIILADISEHSEFQHEEEILFDLGSAFIIDNVVYDTDNKIWLIYATATDKGAEVANDYINFQKKKIAESNIVLMFGHLLADMGEYAKSQQYFENVLRGRPNDEEVACIYYNIGRVHRLKGEYERSLDYYFRAYQMHSEARPARMLSAAKSLNGIGVVYNEKQERELSLNYLMQALKIYEKTLQDEHENVAGTLTNIGNVYRDQGHFDTALEYLTKALKINEKVLPANHPNLAFTLNNMGNVYYKKTDYKRALEYYTHALKLKEETLPRDHPDIARGLNNIGLIYYSTGAFDTALDVYTRAYLMCVKTLSDAHPLCLTIQNNIKLCVTKKDQRMTYSSV
ncbi:unnamed protein product [Didymodactylos carnosus]|uniref:Kinesin light chain n=2 Tax=Didymodactylos carnosus TaxID=1234261 RepID=A0A814U570_9BILA|nr:unnamed protein product [Didymodactylos carnosus]CAF3932650.1 unnamed protein product [Didymodactylos carnosus]